MTKESWITWKDIRNSIKAEHMTPRRRRVYFAGYSAYALFMIGTGVLAPVGVMGAITLSLFAVTTLIYGSFILLIPSQKALPSADRKALEEGDA